LEDDIWATFWKAPDEVVVAGEVEAEVQAEILQEADVERRA